jgi:hypothetical protein
MDETVQAENPLGLAPWISTEALNALNVTAEAGELATINPKQLLLALLVLLLGTGASFMLYSVSLRIPNH